jgi:hypothetical protein
MTPEQFLTGYPPQIQELAHRARELVKLSVVGVDEQVYTGWRLIGYRVKTPGQSGRSRGAYFCFIAPGTESLQLGFEYGVLLSDPNSLLEGDGKQVRYVAIAAATDFDQPGLREVVAEAARVAVLSKEEKANLRLELEETRDLNGGL